MVKIDPWGCIGFDGNIDNLICKRNAPALERKNIRANVMSKVRATVANAFGSFDAQPVFA